MRSKSTRPLSSTQPRPSSCIEYPSLDTTQESFRLLRLHPGNRRHPIRCELFSTNLSHWKGRNTAVSFVWGAQKSEESILVNGHQFFMRRNTFEFLRACRLHHQKRDVVFWIDAICIYFDRPRTKYCRKLRFDPHFCEAVWFCTFPNEDLNLSLRA